MAACKSHAKMDELQSLVEEWQGREIKLPDVMTDVLTGDTIDLSDADFTILSYVDSTGCTGCRMKLSLWDMYLSSLYNDSTIDAEVVTLMVVCPKNDREIVSLLKKEAYLHPVYSDKKDKINTVNSFPTETTFRTFLLDRNRKVIGIGNPAIQEGVAEFYNSIIKGQKVPHPNAGMITVDGNLDLGSICVGDSTEGEISLYNTGNDTVFIRSVVPSCDCTEAEIPCKFISPKAKLPVRVRFNSDSVGGKFNRQIAIYYEDIDYPSIVQIYGEIKYIATTTK